MHKYLSAALGPILVMDIGLASFEVQPPDQSTVSNDQECQTTYREVDAGPASPSYRTMTRQGQGASQSQGRTVGQGQPSGGQGHAAVMPTLTKKESLSRRPSTKVVPQKTIPEEPGSLPPASLPVRSVKL